MLDLDLKTPQTNIAGLVSKDALSPQLRRLRPAPYLKPRSPITLVLRLFKLTGEPIKELRWTVQGFRDAYAIVDCTRHFHDGLMTFGFETKAR